MLLIDIGNSRIKWAWSDGRRLRDTGVRAHSGPADPSAFAFLEKQASPDRLLVANVAGDAMEQALRTAVAACWPLQPELVRTAAAAAGLINGYHDPGQLGVDRWLAMQAAWLRKRAAVCVVDAGTAITVDLIEDSGRHQGGFIVPGLELMTAALGRGTVDITRRAGTGPARDEIPARDTGTAIRAGGLLALAGLVDRACALGGSGAPAVMLTGGDAARLLPLLDPGAELCPDLVLEGLQLVAANQQE